MVMFHRILTWPGRAEDAGPTVQGDRVERMIVVPQLHRAVTSRARWSSLLELAKTILMSRLPVFVTGQP